MSRPFEQILQELVEAMDNPVAVNITKSQEKEISETLSTVSGLPEFLKDTMGADIRRYFAASPETQQQIKGAFARTSYLLKLCLPKDNYEHAKKVLSSNNLQQ